MVSSLCLLSSAHSDAATHGQHTIHLILALPSIAIIPNIPRPKHTVKQPSGNPIGPVLAIGDAAIEERTRGGAGFAPDLEDSRALTFGTDMMPEEGRPG